MARCDHLVVLSAVTVPGVAAAVRLARRLPECGARRHLVTRGRTGGVRPESVSRLLGIPLLCAMGDQRGLDEAIDLGAGPTRLRRGPLARAARAGVEVLVPAAGAS